MGLIHESNCRWKYLSTELVDWRHGLRAWGPQLSAPWQWWRLAWNLLVSITSNQTKLNITDASDFDARRNALLTPSNLLFRPHCSCRLLPWLFNAHPLGQRCFLSRKLINVILGLLFRVPLLSLLFSPGQILRWKRGLLEGGATEKRCAYFNSVLFGIIFPHFSRNLLFFSSSEFDIAFGAR